MCVLWCAVGSLFQTVPAADVETLLTMNWDPNIALSITSELVVMEVINRIFICIFEVSVNTTKSFLSCLLLEATCNVLFYFYPSIPVVPTDASWDQVAPVHPE